MKLTLGKDLGLVMAKGVLLGVITTLTVFPVLLLYFDNAIEKTKHKSLLPKFTHLNNFVIKNHACLTKSGRHDINHPNLIFRFLSFNYSVLRLG